MKRKLKLIYLIICILIALINLAQMSLRYFFIMLLAELVVFMSPRIISIVDGAEQTGVLSGDALREFLATYDATDDKDTWWAKIVAVAEKTGLKNGDVVIMMSDGAVDNSLEEIKKYVTDKGFSYDLPEKLCAVAKAKNKSHSDDITVAVIKIQLNEGND